MSKAVVLASYSYFPAYGGVENSLYYLAKEYVKVGIVPIVLVADSVQGARLPHKEEHDGIVIQRFRSKAITWPLLSFLNPLLMIFSLFVQCRLLAANYDVQYVISRNQVISFFMSIFSGRRNTYIAPGFAHEQQRTANLTAQVSFARHLKFSLKRFLHHVFDYLALRTADRVVVFSENMQQQALRVWPGVSRKMVISKPGVDTYRFRPPRSMEEVRVLRLELGLPLDATLVLGVGRFVSAKGFDILIESMALLPANYHLVLVGDGQDRVFYEELVEKLNLGPRVHFAGARKDTERYYRSADIFVMSSRYEPLGQTILEALASGLVIISPNNSGAVVNATKEICLDFAWYIQSLDQEHLKDGILMADSLRVPKMVAERVGMVRAIYSWRGLVDVISCG